MLCNKNKTCEIFYTIRVVIYVADYFCEKK